MSIVKPKLSSIASNRLPEFIREDYQTFVAFIEAYYEFLDQNVILDYASISDIDTTLDSFIQYFKDELALNFPSTQVDDRFLLPKLKELYTAKGTEASYRLLFRLLYNKEIDIIYPVNQILKVSDGKWIQDTSIFVNISIGTPDIVVGQIVEILTIDKKIPVFVDRYAPTSNPNVFELFITNWLGNFDVGNNIVFGSSFIGSIIAVPNKISVLQAGKNFKVGQIYPINTSSTTSYFKITKVGKNGGIVNAKFISFDVGYTSNFTTNLNALVYKASKSQNYFTITGTSVGITDSISSLGDSGSISKFDYTGIDYIDNTYVGATIAIFSDSYGTSDDLTKQAILAIYLGPYATYPGYYKNEDGFLDDNRVIQDSKFYQAFSYIIKTNILFDSYKSVIKNLIHPAGTEIFGEYNIDLNINANISTSMSIITENNYINTESYSRIITESNDRLIAE
ncbi:hypothetical protein UFOVP84_18 [uncultured Caudovirales phage]|uniref:Baseplate wedge subunit n=1 Tax=uncultured Caudovirales phage TaxID=2100421 RepID=A0A6J5KXE6_9CAUD|nr:hypothetical protein UFOVP84_18 [uncultured Caudovirales phage]